MTKNILEEIIGNKKKEVEEAKDRFQLDKLKKLISQKEIKKRDFFNNLKVKVEKKEIGLIAEVKKASPSKGILKEDFNHIEIAKAYEAGGASCLSILTDKKYFQGNLNHIADIKEMVELPILRKDFIIDPYQIYESIYYGADCILLIASALEKDMLKRLLELSIENNIDTLTEVHNKREIETALEIGTNLIGINNRDLNTFEADLNTSKKLVTYYKKDLINKIIVSESGIFTNKDIKSLTEHNIYAFLVGEGLIKENDIESATKELINF
ncbi:MAG: indole-3-glycerol phosphate synthase TrpC [Candidatus Melainabacteria bacterium]|nr:indole-3-glycerol phosphate synthase TrpC [Candidatus Melainabacteria bacterium]MBI3309600.1 indole-3-glycerol phosphate synthase TrpC [Candidatus Melainabacteria bacterium]